MGFILSLLLGLLLCLALSCRAPAPTAMHGLSLVCSISMNSSTQLGIWLTLSKLQLNPKIQLKPHCKAAFQLISRQSSRFNMAGSC